MKIGPKTVVEMDYAVLLDSGEVGESTFGRGPIQFIYGDHAVVPGLYKGILGLGKGDRRSFKLDPTEGYGIYEESEVRKVPRVGLPPEVSPEPEMNLQVQDPTGQYRLVTIKEVEDETLTVDFNHPYAGKTLTFDVLIRNVREVTDEELEQGLTPQIDEGQDEPSVFSQAGQQAAQQGRKSGLGELGETIMGDEEPPDSPDSFH